MDPKSHRAFRQERHQARQGRHVQQAERCGRRNESERTHLHADLARLRRLGRRLRHHKNELGQGRTSENLSNIEAAGAQEPDREVLGQEDGQAKQSVNQ